MSGMDSKVLGDKNRKQCLDAWKRVNDVGQQRHRLFFSDEKRFDQKSQPIFNTFSACSILWYAKNYEKQNPNTEKASQFASFMS